jgi:glycosyltransferase involved in cell wall biosynthesis
MTAYRGDSEAQSCRDRAATFVIPCLNEAGTLREFLSECKIVFDRDTETDWEILVVDNGSMDGSVQIAQREGASVVSAPIQGYGSAVHTGILAARPGYVVYADADGTYAPADAVKLLSAIRSTGADLVIGSRIRGEIEKGAMPWLHRHLGTPVLSILIRKLYKLPISDCNCGIRSLQREAYTKWDLSGQGMEFASAMLIRAASCGAKVTEIPVRLRRGPRGRVPHLRKWRDGMRHLLTILAGVPNAFWYPGLVLLVLSLVLALPSIWGPLEIASGVRFFGPHTQAISIMIGFYGAVFSSLALSLYGRAGGAKEAPRLASLLTRLREDLLFWALIALFSAFLLGGAYAVWQWSRIHYSDLAFLKFTLGLIYFTLVPTALVFGVVQFHLQKRAML